MKNASAGLVLTLLISMSAAAPAQDAFSPEKRQVIAEVDALEAQIADMSMELWNFSEIALKEHQSAEFLADILEAEGFSVERGVADMPTAFVAAWGSGEPVIGILAEYDALPDIGNDPERDQHWAVLLPKRCNIVACRAARKPQEGGSGDCHEAHDGCQRYGGDRQVLRFTRRGNTGR